MFNTKGDKGYVFYFPFPTIPICSKSKKWEILVIHISHLCEMGKVERDGKWEFLFLLIGIPMNSRLRFSSYFGNIL